MEPQRRSSMFSSTAEYALRAVVYLATRPENLSNSRAVAAVTRVPARYLSKILQDLAENGVVISQRGPNGGFRLARDASQITVLEVLNAVDPVERIKSCPLGLPAHGTKLCKLHRKLDDAIAMIEQTFATSTIADMLDPAKPGSKCIFPTVNGHEIGQRTRRRKSHT